MKWLAAASAANGLGGSYGVTVTAGGVSTPVVFHLTYMPVYLTAASTGSGSGAVTSDPAGIDCGRNLHGGV